MAHVVAMQLGTPAPSAQADNHSIAGLSRSSDCSSSDASEEEGSTQQEGTEVLATLAALGVSDELRAKVQEAIHQLEQLEADSLNLKDTHPAVSNSPGSKLTGKGPAAAAKPGSSAAPKVLTVEAKLQMSRSIMRKLHHKNVALEKELQVSQVLDQCLQQRVSRALGGQYRMTKQARNCLLVACDADVQGKCESHHVLPVNIRDD